jgi:hypothetical protein
VHRARWCVCCLWWSAGQVKHNRGGHLAQWMVSNIHANASLSPVVHRARCVCCSDARCIAFEDWLSCATCSQHALQQQPSSHQALATPTLATQTLATEPHSPGQHTLATKPWPHHPSHRTPANQDEQKARLQGAGREGWPKTGCRQQQGHAVALRLSARQRACVEQSRRVMHTSKP